MENKRKSRFTLASILGGVLLAMGLTWGYSVYGNFVGSPGSDIMIYRKPKGSVDTVYTTTDSVTGAWAIAHDRFTPPAEQNETLYIFGSLNQNGKAKTFLVRGPPEYNSLDLTLDKHTACIKDVYDSTGLSDTIKLIHWIDSFPAETMSVTTTLSPYWKFDVHAPLDTLQATQDAQGHFRFYKTKGDTTFFRNFDFTVDTTRFDAQLVKDTIYFTRDSFYVNQTQDTIDFSVTEIVAPTDSVDTQSVITPIAKVKNLGNKASSGNLEMKIGESYTDTASFQKYNLEILLM